MSPVGVFQAAYDEIDKGKVDANIYARACALIIICEARVALAAVS